MLFFTSSLDQAADKFVSAHFEVAEAERKGLGAGTALDRMKVAEAAWQAICDGMKSRSRTKLFSQKKGIAGRA